MKVSFHVPKSQARTVTLLNGVEVRHVYPTLAEFVGGIIPSEINPRSHGVECLKGKLPAEIEATIRDEPDFFVLANRGCTIVASAVEYDPKREIMTLFFEDPDLERALTGMPDGATTDAVIAKVQGQEADAPLDRAQVHLEIFTNIKLRDSITALAEGRNRGRQVKGWSMANFNGRYDWIKDLLGDTDFAQSIAYEENADDKDIEVLDIIALINLFHKQYCDGSTKSPTVSYNSKKQGLLRRIEDEMSETARVLELTRPVVLDILRLRDRMIVDVPLFWDGRPGRIFKVHEHAVRLPFQTPGLLASHHVPDGVLYPLLASLRCLLTYERGEARWISPPFVFWKRHGAALVHKMQDLLDSPMYTSVTQFGQKPGNYAALLDAAMVCRYRDTERDD